MALNSLKPHLGILGRTNVGKSSLINALSRQSISIVSQQPGTTTDAVSKAIELGEVGPVVLLDTAGLDDRTQLGLARENATWEAIKKIDLGIIVFENNLFDQVEISIIEQLQKNKTPYLCLHNKSDLVPLDLELAKKIATDYNCQVLPFSCLTSDEQNIDKIISVIGQNIPSSVFNNPSILGDLVLQGDHVLLVTPIDVEAPKGRIILPQVQTIRDALDNDCIVTILKERELDAYFRGNFVRPKLVITDSQVFLKVNASVPSDIPLTSFSILFARLKGDFWTYAQGVRKISDLKDGDRILILESCSHHVTGDDIGRVKIPRWISNFTGKKLQFDVVASFNKLPVSIEQYSLVIQCGGCMLTRKQVLNKLAPAIEANIPVTNYGMSIAYTLGIFERAMSPFVTEVETPL